MKVCTLSALWFFTSGVAAASPYATGCSQYGRHEMGYGLTILLVVLLLGQRRREGSELPNLPAQ